MKTSIYKHTFSLYPNKLLILLHLQLAVGSFSSQLNSVVAPLSKLGLAHFLFHIASIVLLVCTIVYLPHRITLYLLLEVVAHCIITTSLRRIAADQALAVV